MPRIRQQNVYLYRRQETFIVLSTAILKYIYNLFEQKYWIASNLGVRHSVWLLSRSLALHISMHVMATLDGGSTFWWISTPRCIFIHMKPTKGTSLVISASFEPLHIFHRRFVRAVRESEKREIKKIKIKIKIDVIFHTYGERQLHSRLQQILAHSEISAT